MLHAFATPIWFAGNETEKPVGCLRAVFRCTYEFIEGCKHMSIKTCLRYVTVFALMALGLACSKEDPAPPPPPTWQDKVKQRWDKTKSFCSDHKEELTDVLLLGGALAGDIYLNSHSENEGHTQFTLTERASEAISVAQATRSSRNFKRGGPEPSRERSGKSDREGDQAENILPIIGVVVIAMMFVIGLTQRKLIKGSDTMGSGKQQMKVWPYPGYNPNPVFVDSSGSSIQIRRIGRPIGGISPSSMQLTNADNERLMQFVKYEHDEFEHDLLQLMGGNVKVSIRADINGRFLCADNLGSPDSRPLIANRDAASDWETFTIFLNPDSFSLKSNANGKFVSVKVNDGGRLIAEAAKIGLCEKFLYARRILDNRNRLLLRSLANEKFVSVDPNTGNVRASADVPREWEWLLIDRC